MERTLDDGTIAQLAEHCERAELEKREIIKLTDDYPDMNFADATAVQWQMRRNKVARGARIAGMKMGLTSWAKMNQMGVTKGEPSSRLTAMRISTPGSLRNALRSATVSVGMVIPL